MYWLFGSALSVQALGAAPHHEEYAEGISIEAARTAPLLELTLPDIVYRTIARADLGDIAVFNAEGATVPISICASPAAAAAVVTQQPLPVFELQEAVAPAGSDSRIDVNTPGGTVVKIQEERTDAAGQGATETRAHVIDARSVTDALRAIQFEWRSPDDASQARVQIEASDDLDRWHTVVQASTLLRVEQEGRRLTRESVPLPQRSYRFLRVARADGGPPLIISSAIAERVAAPLEIDPVWFAAETFPSTEKGEWLFDSARLAPVAYARLHLPQDNMSVQIRIQSRSGAQEPWRDRWSGEAYVIVTDGERRTSAPARFDARTDRYWRVLHDATTSAIEMGPMLELGYRPARLQFLTQGGSPFTLAFGSRRTQLSAAQRCGSLIADRRSDDPGLVEEAMLGAQRTLGGALALQPPAQPTPVKRIALWVVLVAGVALLVAMALSLLRRVKSRD